MKWFRIFLDFYIESSIHVALAVVSLTLAYLTKMDMLISGTVLSVNFFATILGYNFVKYADVLVKSESVYSNKMKGIIALSFFSFCCLFYFVFQLNFSALLVILVSTLATILYSASIFPIPYFKQLNNGFRNIPVIKVFIIALVWSLVVVLFPVVQLRQQISLDICVNMLEVFLLVIALMVPFEIRDVIYDARTLKTLPQILGVNSTKLLGVLLCGIVFILEVICFGIDYRLTVILFVLSFVILRSKESQEKYYCSFFVEAIPILWLMLLLVF